MLEVALRKAGLSVDDLVDEARSYHAWTFRGNLEKGLLGQILWTVFGGSSEVVAYKSAGKIGCDVTPEERVRIDMLWTLHRRAFRKEMKLLLRAYIHAQRLFPPDAPEPMERELTDEEQEELERLAQMIAGIKSVSVHLQLQRGRKT
jgi:hypothetical protein